jgi:hypothetical protein
LWAASGAAEVSAEDGVGLNHIADGACPDVFAETAVTFAAMALVAHLSVHLMFFCGFGQDAAFSDVVGKGFLYKDVLVEFDCTDGGRGVVVVRGGDEDYVDVFVAFVEHLAIVMVSFGVGQFVLDAFDGFGHGIVVDVAEGDAAVVGGSVGVASAGSAAAYDGDAWLGVWGFGEDIRWTVDTGSSKSTNSCSGFLQE